MTIFNQIQRSKRLSFLLCLFFLTTSFYSNSHACADYYEYPSKLEWCIGEGLNIAILVGVPVTLTGIFVLLLYAAIVTEEKERRGRGRPGGRRRKRKKRTHHNNFDFCLYNNIYNNSHNTQRTNHNIGNIDNNINNRRNLEKFYPLLESLGN